MKVTSITEEEKLFLSDKDRKRLEYTGSVFSLLCFFVRNIIAFYQENFISLYRIKWYQKTRNRIITMYDIYTYSEAKKSISGGIDHLSYDTIKEGDRLWIERIK